MGSVKFSAFERDFSTNGKWLRCLICLCSAQGPGQCLLIGDAALDAPTCIRLAGMEGSKLPAVLRMAKMRLRAP